MMRKLMERTRLDAMKRDPDLERSVSRVLSEHFQHQRGIR